MKVSVTLCWIFAASIALAGCQSKTHFTETTTDITRGYEHKRDMSRKEAQDILGKYLSARYPKLDSYSGVTSNIPYKVFRSIDENGFTLDVFHAAIDSRQRTVVFEGSQVAPEVEQITLGWHWEDDGSAHATFADVNRITVRHTTNDKNPLTYDEVRLIYVNGENGGYWGLGSIDKRPDGTALPLSEIVSALFALCPNAK